MNGGSFNDFDFADFWDDCSYSKDKYIEDYPSDELIASIEKEVGYKFPSSYIEFMRLHNGGLVFKSCYPMTERTSWAADHVAIEGFLGIGRTKTYAIAGNLGSKFMIEEWGYPNTGIYICDCPSAGHDMILLDYSECKNNEAPKVVHVDQEFDYKKTLIAPDFKSFVEGLVSPEEFE